MTWACANTATGTWKGAWAIAYACAMVVLFGGYAYAQKPVLGWTAAPASGVEMRLRDDAGTLRVDFDFQGGGGWAAFRKDTALRLPENYEFSFRLKADAPVNTLEFKLIDVSGENVWWVRRPEFEFSGDWRTVRFRKRHIEFAWGPKGGGEVTDVAAVEFAITAGKGGKGSVWIDDLTLTARPPVTAPPGPPVVSRSRDAYTLDLRAVQEYGGVSVRWNDSTAGRDYDVQISQDGRRWETVRRVRSGRRAEDLLQLPESESRYLRIVPLRNASTATIRYVHIEPLEFGVSPNRLYERLARAGARDLYPAYFHDRQTYWTVVGNPAAEREALFNEYGALEVGKRSFSLEPFLYDGHELIGWAAADSVTLEDGYLPIPSVRWRRGDLQLNTTTWTDSQALWVRYRVTNRSAQPRAPTLYVALRPFQVNPTRQFLNTPGGVAFIERIAFDGTGVRVDSQSVVPITRPGQFGATTFDQGDIADYLVQHTLPPSSSANDTVSRLASGALAYPITLPARDSIDVYLAVPFNGSSGLAEPSASLQATAARWRSQLERFDIDIPRDPDVARSIRSNVAYILINQDGPAIQPGSRSYERSWIRDGSLTSAVLLRLGQTEPVRRFIEWYAPYQYADGKVPCCVDPGLGAGAVPENDSHGQLIYVVAEYFRYTRDTALVRRTWPHVVAAVEYMDSLRQSRRTGEYRGTGFWGMMPQSISHEGYSAKPMHSYWDDFFALKGFKDAAWLAARLGDTAHARQWTIMRDEFNSDLINSFRWTMRKHGIDYLAGSVELGDFDATSTTVGLNPAGAQHDLPQNALRQTFERYWSEFQQRRSQWAEIERAGYQDTTRKFEAYTPYEWRVVGALVRLGERERAHEVAQWFMEHQRPDGWNHWAEVVFRNPRASNFIGDMPHTWVGSDFIRSVLDMFVYDDDDTLVIGAGIPESWLGAEPVRVAGLRTPHGVLGYRVFNRNAGELMFRFDESPHAPRGFVIRSPGSRPIRAAHADGRPIAFTATEVKLTRLPRELSLSY